MKYIVLLFLLFHLNINAQNKEQLFGLRISGGLASFSNEDLPSRYHPRGISYNIALSTYVKRNNHSIGLNIEIEYAQKNVKDDFMGYSLNYLSLGFMPNYYLKNTSSIIFLGASAAILPSYSIINDYPKGQVGRFNFYDINLIVGFSQKLFTFERFKVDLDSRFNLGLMNIQDSYWGGRTQNYGFSIGILIKKELRKSK